MRKEVPGTGLEPVAHRENLNDSAGLDPESTSSTAAPGYSRRPAIAALVGVLLGALLGASAASAAPPVTLVSPEDVARMDAGAAAGTQPWPVRRIRLQFWADLAAGTEPYTGVDPAAFRGAFEWQALANLSRAILSQSASTDPTEAAQLEAQARDFVVGWAEESLPGVSSVQQTTDPLNAGLRIGVWMTRYTAAYGLLRDAGALSASDEAIVQSWLLRVHGILESALSLWRCGPACGGPNPCHKWSNHPAVYIDGMAAIAAALGDDARWDSAVALWKEQMERQLYMDGEAVIGCDSTYGIPAQPGQVVDRYRHHDGGFVAGPVNDPADPPHVWTDARQGYGYSLFAMERLSNVAELSERRGGEDLFAYRGPNGEELLTVARHLALAKYEAGPSLSGTTRSLIPHGYFWGEISYDGYNVLFEHLAARIGDPLVALPLEQYDALSRPRWWFEPAHLGHAWEKEN